MDNNSVNASDLGERSDAEKEKENAKELALRTGQLNLVKTAIEKLDDAANEAGKKNKRRKALLSHLRTFYSEMSSISKGKGMNLIPVAELMVTQINDVIADAKKLIVGDIYLDRVKPFISAGNPPSYPEVLLVAKTVEEVLVRLSSDFDAQLKAINDKKHEAATVQAGLECAMENVEYAVSIESVEEKLGDVPDSSWTFTDDEGEELFDLSRLDELDISAHFAEIDQKTNNDEGHHENESEENEDDE